MLGSVCHTKVVSLKVFGLHGGSAFAAIGFRVIGVRLASGQCDRNIARSSSSGVQVDSGISSSQRRSSFLSGLSSERGDACLNILLNNNISTATHKGMKTLLLRCITILSRYIFRPQFLTL